MVRRTNNHFILFPQSHKFVSLILLTLLVTLSACIGTVEEKNPDDALGASTTTAAIQYSGLTKVRPISDSKVIVYFPPITTIPMSNVNYLIYVNETESPLKISPTSLTLHNGLYEYIIDKLQPLTTYTIRVAVLDITTGIKSEDSRIDTVTTFGNTTCDFDGVQKVIVPPGSPGTTSLNIYWNKAKTDNTILATVDSDPIQYVVYLLADSEGSEEDLISLSNPNIMFYKLPINLSNKIANTTSFTIENLNPDSRYHVMVRCTHYGYSKYSDIPTYKLEENRKVISAMTTSTTGTITFGGSLANLAPAGSAGESARTILWNPADGNFNSYRIYYKLVGQPDADASTLAVDEIDDTYMDDSSASFLEITDTSATTATVTGLSPYAYYQFKVAACIPIAPNDDPASKPCDTNHRVTTDFTLTRITPLLTPFSGITIIGQPTSFYNCSWDSSKTCGSVFLNFNAPTTDIGALTNFEIHCSDDNFANDDNIIPLSTESVNYVNNSNSICNHIARVAPSSSYWNEVTQIELKDIEINDQGLGLGRLYFTMYPYNEFYYNNNQVYLDINNSSPILSIYPQIKAPTADEFKGATSCSVDFANKSITINWELPLGGNYGGFELFIKKHDGIPFSYSAARDSKLNDDNTNYNWTAQIADRTATSATITTATLAGTTPNDITNFLDWGNSYDIGVLTSLADKTNYSEPNSGIVICSIDPPKLNFQAWENILAIGPKVDALVPESKNDGLPYTLIETLNVNGMPQEVMEPRDDNDLIDYDNLYNGIANVSTIIHDGTFHTTDGKPYNGGNLKGNFSRTGIVQIVWRDALLPDGQPFYSLLEDTNNDGIIDNNEADTQQTGYQVFRSSDNGYTWENLTSSDYPFSNSTKYIIPKKTYTNAKNNDLLKLTMLASFTDYSANSIISSAVTEKARTYLYKVVPYYRGVQLTWDTSTKPKQNTIKVTMPPPNMALVHRLIANKKQCEILGLVPGAVGYDGAVIPDWDITNHYACPYNGVGAKFLGIPWESDDSVYDLGGDLLVDRFELGCHFSRPDSTTTGGCYAPNTSPSSTNDGPELYHYYHQGDCLYQSTADFYNADDCDSSSAIPTVHYPFFFPGVADYAATRSEDDLTCATDHPDNAGDFFNPTFEDGETNYYNDYAHRSSFAATAYLRMISTLARIKKTYQYLHGTDTNGKITAPSYENDYSQCLVNLPYNYNGKNDLPRWLSLKQLSRDVNVQYTDSINTIKTNPVLYDATTTPSASAPDSEMPIGKVITSNGANLPPIIGLNQKESYQLCNSYKVELGAYDDENETFISSTTIKEKRLLRRKEFLAASLWADNMINDRLDADNDLNEDDGVIDHTYSERTITEIESGSYTQTIDNLSVTVGALNNTKAIDGIATLDDTTSYLGTNYATKETSSTTFSPLVTGSNYYDYFNYKNSTNITRSNTQANVSRFGIQDLVGNMAEYSSDRLFPNLAGFTVYLTTSSDNKTWTKIVGLPCYYNVNYFPTGIVISAPTGGGQASPIYNGSPIADGIISTYGNTVLPSVLSDGSFNTFVQVDPSLILDPQSLDDWRTGGGGFLSFGDSDIGPSIKFNDVLSLQLPSDDPTIESRVHNTNTPNDPRSYNYFSPVLGLPLACNEVSCNSSSDNKRTTTYGQLNSDNTGLTLPSGLRDIPINNSQIYSDGLGEQIYGDTDLDLDSSSATWGYDLYAPLMINDQGPWNSNDVALRKLTGIAFNTVNGNSTTNLQPIADDDGVNNTDSDDDGFYDKIDDFKITARHATWQVRRGNYPLFLVNGGSYRDNYSGHYSTRINNMETQPNWGVRCAVMINQE